MIRKLISTINKSLTKRVVSSRKVFQVPVKIWLEPNRSTGNLQFPPESYAILGETADLSSTGIGFIVSSIRIRENYLIGEGRTINAELDLPGGKVQMQIVGRRHEQVGQHISTARFLIGAEIVKMSGDNREIYEQFLRLGNKLKTGELTLGVDQT